jgi:hypothetical protein
MNFPEPPLTPVGWTSAYRIIPSHFPPINVFEEFYEDAEEMELAFALESMTNDRLLACAGELRRVPKEDWIFGCGATAIMAAFTHIGFETRFSNGNFGVYYAARSEATAVAETAYHRQRFLAATNEPDVEITMRVLINRIEKPLRDIRGADYEPLHHPHDYGQSQAFGRAQYEARQWGILYRSVRDPHGECAAVLRPKAMTLTIEGKHLRYVWNGAEQRFVNFYEIRSL